MKRIALFIILLSQLLLCFGQEQNGGFDKKTITSKTLKETITYWEKHIGEAQKSDTINIVVLLDGDEYFGFAKDILHLHIAAKQVYPTILVGLPSTMKSRWKYYTPTKAKPYKDSDKETRELFKVSGHFKEYATFIDKELLPRVTKEMDKKIKYKTIFGHSMGGLAALSFLIQEQPIFDNYIVASPSTIWDKYHIVEQVEEASKEKARAYNFQELYITIAEDDIAYYEDGMKYFLEFLEKSINPTNTKITQQKYISETHMTVGLPTLFDGIKKILRK